MDKLVNQNRKKYKGSADLYTYLQQQLIPNDKFNQSRSFCIDGMEWHEVKQQIASRFWLFSHFEGVVE